MKHILVLGALSDIAMAIVKRFAREGYGFSLAALRNDSHHLDVFKNVIEKKYLSIIHLYYFDALDFASHQSFYNSLIIKPDVVLCAFGYIGDHSNAEINFNEAQKIIYTNFVGAVSILNIIAIDFKKRKQGIIIGISSITGDRGRQQNYFYGSAKAGFTHYLDSLRNKLFNYNVHVMTIKPGFVTTKMLPTHLSPKIITSTPEKVAEDVYRAFLKKKNILYTPWYWRYLMFILRSIPEPLFKRMKV